MQPFSAVFSAGDTQPPVPNQVIRRTGAVVPFDEGKIQKALLRAGRATGEFDAEEAWLLTWQVLKVLRHRFTGASPHVEQIQDIVEQTLIAANHFATMRAYAVYREQHSKLRQDRKTVVDVSASINEYVVSMAAAVMLSLLSDPFFCPLFHPFFHRDPSSIIFLTH